MDTNCYCSSQRAIGPSVWCYGEYSHFAIAQVHIQSCVINSRSHYYHVGASTTSFGSQCYN